MKVVHCPISMATALAAIFLAGVSPKGSDAQTPTRALTEVYHNNDFQLTGIAVSKTGRLFVNFPRWSDQYQNAVIEVMPDGSSKPYPDEFWNRWNKQPETAGKQFVCVQSVFIDDNDMLWVLDPAAPMLLTVVPGGPKLVEVDLKSNQVKRVIAFGPDVAKPNSYLNDIRIDTKRNFAYMTDSGAGGLVVLDLNSGKAHRELDNDKSVEAVPGVKIVIDGKPVLGPDGKPPMFKSDGIALSLDGGYLYYQALAGDTLYRIKTEVLRNNGADAQRVASAVEKAASTFPADGLWIGRDGTLYLSNLDHDGVSRLGPNGEPQLIVEDKRLQWPDTFAEGPDGAIYISASHINESPGYNDGRSARKLPYGVFKFRP